MTSLSGFLFQERPVWSINRHMTAGGDSPGARKGLWTFLSNHAHVLVLLAGDPDARLRDLAGRIGVTERAVHRIVHDLEDAGVLEHVREGRRNHYTIHIERHLRHPLAAHVTVGDLLRMVTGKPPTARAGKRSNAQRRTTK